MKLFTQEINKKLFAQYSKGSDLSNQMVVAKIFNPYGRGTWYLINSDEDDPDYLWAIVDLFEVEVGSVSRKELESIKIKPFNFGLERDLSFSPKNAEEVFKGLLSGKTYAKGGKLKYDPTRDVVAIAIKDGVFNKMFTKGDFLGGAYQMESGGVLKDYNYVSPRNIIFARLKSGEDIKPVNGFYIRKNASGTVMTEAASKPLKKASVKSLKISIPRPILLTGSPSKSPNMMKFIGTFSGKDLLRPAMTFVQVKDGSIVATDAHKLIRIIDGSTLKDDKLVCESTKCKNEKPDDQKFPITSQVINSIASEFSESYDMVDLYESLMQVRNDDLKNKVSKMGRVIELKLENQTIYFNITLLLECVKGCLLLGWKKAFISYSQGRRAIVFTEEKAEGRLREVSLILLMPILGSESIEKVTVTPKMLLEQGGMMGEGAETMIQPTILQNNPNYLVGTTSMYEMFEDGGMMAKGGILEQRALRLFDKLKQEGKLKRYIDTRGDGKKYFETIVPNYAENGYWRRFESTSRGNIGVLQNEYLDKNDVLHHLKKTMPVLEENDEMALGGMMAKGGSMAEYASIDKLWSKVRNASKKIYEESEGYVVYLNDDTLNIGDYKDLKLYSAQADEDGEITINLQKSPYIIRFTNAVDEKREDRSSYDKYGGLINILEPLTESIAKQLLETSTLKKYEKGGKIRDFDDVLVISKNKLGMVEAIAGETYYISTPFGESFEATLDDLRRVKSFAQGGAMEHMIFKGDKVLAIHRNMLIVESDLGQINVLDLSTEPIARRISIEPITGKNTLQAAREHIDYLVSRKPKTMAMGGSLQGHGFEVGDLIVEDLGGYIRVTSEDGKDFFITLRTGDRETEAPLPFKHGGKVKHSDVTRLATKTNEAGDEVVDLADFYEEGGNVPQVFDVPAQFLDSDGQRKNDRKTIRELTDFVLALPQTKEIYFNQDLGDYTPSRKKLHAEIINKFKKEVVCINNDKPIAIFMGGSPASGKSSFLRKYSPFLLKEEILKIDADEIRAMLPEYEGWNAAQTHLETKDIVNILLSNKNIGIPCDFDIIYDGTMNSVKSYIPLMDILRKRGYKIFIVFMDNVPKDVIIKRALDRYKTSGRFVPLEVIEDFFTKGKSAFNELKKDVDGYIVVDGSNQDYRIIEEGGIKLPRERKYSKLGTKIDPSDIPITYKKGGLSKLY